ncbi:MAG: hypothetical protein U0183_14340 [Polyangiaceae bacterium]
MRHRSIAALSTLVLSLGACSSTSGSAAPEGDEAPSGTPGPSAPSGATSATPSPAASTPEPGEPSRDGGPGSDGGGCALPPRDCTDGAAECGKIVPFEPVTGPGYDNYPLNGETTQNQYRSFARKDLVMLVKWVTAFVACKAKPGTGNGAPLGLGDMSEANGAIPGTSVGSPGHPQGTHTNGNDMDIAYYQARGTNNNLRPVCPYLEGGRDAYHCVGAPDNLDVHKTALALGAFYESARVRIIGVDGQVGPLVQAELAKICAEGTLSTQACSRAKSGITFETTDQGRGWYLFHHHHFHVSLKAASAFADPGMALGGVGAVSELHELERSHTPGEAILSP